MVTYIYALNNQSFLPLNKSSQQVYLLGKRNGDEGKYKLLPLKNENSTEDIYWPKRWAFPLRDPWENICSLHIYLIHFIVQIKNTLKSKLQG